MVPRWLLLLPLESGNDCKSTFLEQNIVKLSGKLRFWTALTTDEAFTDIWSMALYTCDTSNG